MKKPPRKEAMKRKRTNLMRIKRRLHSKMEGNKGNNKESKPNKNLRKNKHHLIKQRSLKLLLLKPRLLKLLNLKQPHKNRNKSQNLRSLQRLHNLNQNHKSKLIQRRSNLSKPQWSNQVKIQLNCFLKGKRAIKLARKFWLKSLRRPLLLLMTQRMINSSKFTKRKAIT